ncbi:hypothetical protein D3C78_1193510 [compost metagenome]
MKWGEILNYALLVMVAIILVRSTISFVSQYKSRDKKGRRKLILMLISTLLLTYIAIALLIVFIISKYN